MIRGLPGSVLGAWLATKPLAFQKAETGSVESNSTHAGGVLVTEVGRAKVFKSSCTHVVWLTKKETNPLHGVAGGIDAFTNDRFRVLLG